MPRAAYPPSNDPKEHDQSQVIAFPRSQGEEEQRPSHHNMPLELSSFVGRQREIAEVEERLLADNRLLTLTGPGGCGKTRLALKVASEVAERFEDGAWLVELASLSDPDLVAQAVASALKVREQPGRPLAETLVDALRPRQMLLVLDNCEHLIDACARFAEAMLSSCPGLRILATSREILGIAGETNWAVPSLSVPDAGEDLYAIENLMRYEALRLFVERARSRLPDFELNEETAGAVVEVCRRLEGMPLAIELAAGRVGVLSVEQISGRLKDSLGVLAGGNRTAPSRQRTLRGTLQWSYELLGGLEQELFVHLSVFRGGWTLEAAEAVAAEPRRGIPEEDVLDLLGGLVEKSLVVTEAGQPEREPRYRMLEAVRQYAREKLEEGGGAGEVRRRHATWFLTLAEEAEPHLKGRQQVAWLERLEQEHDNLRAAMRWLLEEGEVETAVRFAWALWFFWYLRGHQSEGRSYAGEILEKDSSLPGGGMRAKALCVRGTMSYGLPESIEQTKRLFEESVALFRRAGDKSGLAIALSGVSATTLQEGDTEHATALLEEALELYREVGDKWGVSSILSHLGFIPLSQDDHARAVRYFEEALAISREIGDRLIGSIALYNLALEESRVQGDRERAAELYVEGLKLAVEMGNKANAAYCLEGLAGLIAEGGEPERAARLFGASEAMLEAVGAPRYVHAQNRALYERSVEALRSRLTEEAFAVVWSEGRAMALEQAIEYVLGPSPSTPQPKNTAKLSAREVEVLTLVAKGLTDSQVAERLYLSPRTVGYHLRSIYNKLGTSSRTAAVKEASEHELI